MVRHCLYHLWVLESQTSTCFVLETTLEVDEHLNTGAAGTSQGQNYHLSEQHNDNRVLSIGL